MFIAFEGSDGAGKSTQVARLVERLRSADRAVVETYEPGATNLGAALRTLLLESSAPIDAWSEAYIYAADRAQHVAEVIGPAVDAGRDVVSDRFLLSSLAYQGAGRGLGIDAVAALNERAVHDVMPDLSIVLDLPPMTGLERAGGGGYDRIESESLEFHDRVREAFTTMAADRADVELVDAGGSIDEVADATWQVVRARAADRGIEL